MAIGRNITVIMKSIFYFNNQCIIFRVFILLTFLGRKSLIAGATKSSVVDSMVRTLGRLLAPLSNGQASNTSRLDTTLIGWVLLFLSVCLDTTAIQPPPHEENTEKFKDQGIFTVKLNRDLIFIR